MPCVSVIVPCYKVEQYLDRCIKSIVNQTLQDIEIILVDDGSPDRVPAMCDTWAQRDDRIKVIHKNNEGAGFARNSGMEVASGEYIAFVDSDDYVVSDMYENLYREAKQADLDVVFCGHRQEMEGGLWKDIQYVDRNTFFFEKKAIQEVILDTVASAPYISEERKYGTSVWQSIFKFSVVRNNKIHFESQRKYDSEDTLFLLDVLRFSKKIAFIPRPFYFYCLNKQSLTTTYKVEKFEQYKGLRELIIAKLQGFEEGENRANRFFIGYVRSNLSQLYSTDIPNKRQILKNIVDDSCWEEIEKHYPPSFLPLYKRLVYFLIIHKCLFCIEIVLKSAYIVKTVLKRRRY